MSLAKKLSLLVIAVVGQVSAAVKGGAVSGATNYGLSSVNYGVGDTSASTFGGGSVNYGSGSSLTSSGFSRTKSSRGFSSGRFGQIEVPQPYNLNYQSVDGQGNSHYHREEADVSGTVKGPHGDIGVKGLYASGYRARIRTNEPGIDGKRNPVGVQIIAEQPPAFILGQYTPFRGNNAGVSPNQRGHSPGAGIANVFEPGVNSSATDVVTYHRNLPVGGGRSVKGGY